MVDTKMTDKDKSSFIFHLSIHSLRTNYDPSTITHGVQCSTDIANHLWQKFILGETIRMYKYTEKSKPPTPLLLSQF